MCGILGAIGSRWGEEVESALTTLAKRGPDARQLWRGENAVLGHARLAVIDAEGGRQPMVAADGRHVLVFNGEIYNFLDLRRELQGLGWRFASRSDSEVLLIGHAQWGEALLQRLDGIFAFAIWDTREQTLFAARDRLGVKPFFYSTTDGMVFASTLAPFFRLSGFPQRLNGRALRDYLAFQTPLAPDCFLADCRQLPPACALHYAARSRSLKTWRYWSIPRPQPGGPTDFPTCVAMADAALKESVKRQLVADVPLGAFLSGGIDSSLIIRYMAEAGVREMRCFSLKFTQSAFDESAHARQVAQQFGCAHHELPAPEIDATAFLTAIADLDQPLADPSYVMTHALSRMTREHVTVALSGDGGDELFGGYPRYADPQSAHPEGFWQAPLRRLVAAGLLPGALTRRTLHGRELLYYRRVELGPWPNSRKGMEGYLAPWIRAACGVEQTLEAWNALVDELGGELDGATMMRADLWSYLSENCLVKTDRASMAHGLEARVPMLGNPVVDAALTIPASIHLADNGKAVLKELCRRGGLPESVWNRPKHGFSIPLRDLFQHSWKQMGDDAFAGIERFAPFLNAPAAREQWQRCSSDRGGARRLTYTLLVLLLWLEHHPGISEVTPCAS
ncbi:MAG: asparagine synthase (glutamine-hydrolyzing) [Magnetococcales bacterium]|nr:asparagine synthase (glutamine-hydrolyzing) [Magnetococcales bacterium]